MEANGDGVATSEAATGCSFFSRTRRFSSCVWCTTSYFPPFCGYSFLMVLKQCAQVTTIFVAPTSFSISTFCCASIWYSTSLPARRAESPVQASPSPRTAKSTPAMSSSSATACVVFFARSSKAPAQPTQKRYSTSSSDSTSEPTCLMGKSRPVAQSMRVELAMPQGFCLLSRFLNRPPSSLGKADSMSTWLRRMSTMASTCSMSTGHCSTHAPQLVQLHSTSGSMTAPPDGMVGSPSVAPTSWRMSKSSGEPAATCESGSDAVSVALCHGAWA